MELPLRSMEVLSQRAWQTGPYVQVLIVVNLWAWERERAVEKESTITSKRALLTWYYHGFLHQTHFNPKLNKHVPNKYENKISDTWWGRGEYSTVSFYRCSYSQKTEHPTHFNITLSFFTPDLVFVSGSVVMPWQIVKALVWRNHKAVVSRAFHLYCVFILSLDRLDILSSTVCRQRERERTMNGSYSAKNKYDLPRLIKPRRRQRGYWEGRLAGCGKRKK